MELFGYAFEIGNNLGVYSFLSFIILIILYFMRPKPFKKVIPSLIFLEKGEKRLNIASFFRKFIKDWLLILQLFLVLFLCLAALDISTEIFLRKINKDVVLVIDTSASSKARYEGKQLFDIYKEIARKKIGVSTSIILAKNSPEIIAKQINPVGALGALNSLRPSDSLSNIWDAMLISSELAAPKSTIVVLSDFADTNNKDLSVAKKVLEAKGFNVEMINPKEKKIPNVGIIKYSIAGDKILVDVKNFDEITREIKIKNNDKTMELTPFSVSQFSVNLKEGVNKIEIETDDDFSVDDKLDIIMPSDTERNVLFITNKRTSFVKSAFESISSLRMKKAEPPIVTVSNQKLFILDNIDYSALLPGTMDQIKANIESGSSLIIMAQNNLDLDKLGELLPIEIGQAMTQDVSIINSAPIEKLKDFNFGLSSKYYQTRLKSNNSIIIAEANDKENSPVIVLSKYGQGNVLYYGIFDDFNAFKISTQYPLFWIRISELLISKEDYNKLNLKVGEIIYATEIKDPDGKKSSSYLVTEKTGIYNLKEGQVAVNLANAVESDLNKADELKINIEKSDYGEQKVRQTFQILPFLIVFAILVSFLEVYIMKRRGDV